MKRAPLPNLVADMIVDIIEQDRLAEDHRLTERSLATRLRVSRTPVRQALNLLEESGSVKALPQGGYAVAERHQGPKPSRDRAREVDDDVYFRIARDRVSGELPERVTENELMRRYDLSRGELVRLLQRIAAEGWLERLPGHGWAFAQTLTSKESLRHCYYYRLQFEPAALVQPTFVVDRPLLERCRDRQIALLNDRGAEPSPVELFEANAELHESLVACSRNPFFVDALKRVNALRRLLAYQRVVARPVRTSLVGEHLHIVDLVLTGDQIGASEVLRQHLEQAMDRSFD